MLIRAIPSSVILSMDYLQMLLLTGDTYVFEMSPKRKSSYSCKQEKPGRRSSGVSMAQKPFLEGWWWWEVAEFS